MGIKELWEIIQRVSNLVHVPEERTKSLKAALAGLYTHLLYLRHDAADHLSQHWAAKLGFYLKRGVERDRMLDTIRLLQPKASPFRLVRLGPQEDSGYLVPDDLKGIVACFSPGVSNSSGFEQAVADRGIRSFMADYSVLRPPIVNPLFEFEKLFIATYNENGKFTRLDDWITRSSVGSGDLLLQMDIEGNEWPILADVSTDILSRFRIVVLELHGLDTLLTSSIAIEMAHSVLKKLNEIFSIVHLHANNCCGALSYQGIQIPRVLEVTLIRKDRYQVSGEVFESNIPNPLDTPNVPNRKELLLTKDWLG
jgi:hypothetical protein